MFFSDGNVKIKVKRYLANNSKETGTIIISHEFGLNMLSTARYARGLRRAGYNVFIFDFAGSGSGLSKGRRSTDMSVLTEKDDLKLVFEHVKKLDYVDPDKLILGGASQGGFVTALFSAERKDEVQKMFLYYPAFNIPDDSKRGNIIGTKIDPRNVPESFMALGYVRLGKKYVIDAQGLDPWNEIKKYDGPVLICHGTNDKLVPISYAHKALAVYKNAKLIEFKGAHHCFFMPWNVGKAVKETIEFLKE